ncbi:MAG: hypothetical protein ACK4S2_14335 [Gemmobacter sp.]|uniref:hypothetical protein n=1 Tax=Gemmobacter sp. TaxID=1898957 RepID=UPI00391AB072
MSIGSVVAEFFKDTANSLFGLFKKASLLLFVGETVIEGLEDLNADDLVLGGDGSDVLYGLGGQDTLIGGRGDDHLFAGRGFDLLFGGVGDDVLYASVRRKALARRFPPCPATSVLTPSRPRA